MKRVKNKDIKTVEIITIKSTLFQSKANVFLLSILIIINSLNYDK